jgi:hypothetical protein
MSLTESRDPEVQASIVEGAVRKISLHHRAASGRLTAEDKYAALSPEVKTFLAHTRPSLLSAKDRAELLPVSPALAQMDLAYRSMAGLLTASEKYAALSPRVKQMIAATTPSKLSPEDQEALLPAKSISILQNYERASGYKVLPTSKAKERT